MLRWVLIALAALVIVGGLFLYKGDLPTSEVDAKYSSTDSKFLMLPNGARTHYRDQGNPAGVPVVLVHGSNASLHTWEPWVAQLGDTYRIVTMDLPGHGLTGRVPDDDYSTEAYVATVALVADAVGIERFVLGGNSMGGGVTWQFALRHPDRVRAMLLVDASGLWSWREARRDDGGERPWAFTLLSQPWFRAVARYLDPWALTVQGVRSAYNDSVVVNDALIERYYELSLREGTRAATMKRFAHRGPVGAPEPDLSVLIQPTLILWGDQDALTPVADARRFADVLPNATVKIYESVGHVPMEEIPERSAADVRAFIESLDDPMQETHGDETL